MRVNGEALKALRTDRGWTLEEVAKVAGVHLSRIWKVENPAEGLEEPAVVNIVNAWDIPLDALADADYPWRQHLQAPSASEGSSEDAA